MSHQRISILGVTLLLIMTSFANAEESERDPDLPPPGFVHVEQTDLVVPKPPEHDYKLKPYVERRGKWGLTVGLDYNAYNPTHYTPNFSGTDFGSVYGRPRSPLMEGQFVVKRNFSFGSLGLEFGGGNYYNAGNDGSKLKLVQFRFGAILILDTLFPAKVPYVAPFASIGAYMIDANESSGGSSFNATTSAAPYISVGAQFTLDWLDSVDAKAAYQAGGVQSTYVYLEVRSYFASSNASDPDFGSSMAPGGGLRVEF